MSEPNPDARATGRCVCEGVSYEIIGDLRDVVDCHCWRCRRWTGHHMAATAAATDDVRFLSDDTLSWYDCDDGAHYGFCSRCGANVAWRHDRRPAMISFCAGLLEPPTGLRTVQAIYTSTASDYHALDPDVPSWPLERA